MTSLLSQETMCSCSRLMDLSGPSRWVPRLFRDSTESYFLAIDGLGIDFQSSIPMVNTRRGG